MVWTCGGVHTKIFVDSIGAEGAKKLVDTQSCTMTNTDRAVNGMLKDLGHTRVTCGPNLFSFMAWLIKSWFQPLLCCIGRKVYLGRAANFKDKYEGRVADQ